MISKECFIDTMRRLEDLDHKMDKVDTALKELAPDFGGFYIPEVPDIVVAILRDVFNDYENDSLGYFIYELDFLRKYKTGSITDAHDNPIDLSTWDKIYDFLLENMES